MRAIKFVFFSLLLFFGLIYLIYVSYFYFNQEEMVFISTKLPSNYKFKFSQTFEEINIKSFDGKKQNGLLFKVDKPKGIIFYLHGNAGSLDSWGNNASFYTDLGYDIFFLDYRGFGKSQGEIENQEQIFKDILIAYDKVILLKEYKKKIVIGYSIGTGIATYLASNKKVDMLILQAPYYNFLEFSSGIVPYFPNVLKKFQFETNKYIINIKSPIYIFHGDEDRVIAYENAIKLKKIIKPTDSLFTLKGQNHLGINENIDYQKKLQEILSRND